MAADKKGPLDAEERLAALGRVMGELVHDLNNEVTILQGWAMLARGELDAGRLPGDEVDRVVGITDVLARMLRDMMDTVAGRGLSPEVTFDPLALTEEVLADRVRALGSATLRLHSSLPEGVRIAGRASFWVRALSNLVGNATRYARTQISVSLSSRAPGEGPPVIVLRVEDDGCGIPAAHQADVFQPFWRGEGGETGLGLSSVAWAVSQLGGTVTYRDDSPLGGAAFEIQLSAAPRLLSRPQLERHLAAELEPIRGARIMLVDDDRAVRHAIRRLLERAGLEVREFDPAGEPEAHVLQAILSCQPDAVLLDLRLGERGGLALWNRMCLEMPRLAGRVIFVTGAAPGEPDWEQARLTGQPLLGKPFDLKELARIVVRFRAEQ